MANAALRRVIGAAAKAEWTGCTDADLLRRFTDGGDQEAFAALVRRHTNLVLGVCRRGLPAAEVDDACQAVFVVLARKAGTTRWQPSIANWLYATARRVCKDARVAAERRTRREGRTGTPEAVTPADRMTAQELFAVLDDELDRLPAIYREPLVLCYLDGLTRDDAAVRLGVPAGTVKVRLERGRKRLADALTRRGVAVGLGLLTLAATSPAGASPPALVQAVLAAVNGAPSPAAVALARGVVMTGVLTRTKLLAVAGLVAVGFGLAAVPLAADDKPAQEMKKPAADGKADGKKPEANERTVSGTVLGVDGKPAAGVKLFNPRLKVARPRTEDDITVVEVGTTDAAGKFRVTLAGPAPRSYLIAHAAGAGIDWVENPTGEVTLRLVPDAPITGRVLSSEGKPVRGVKVSVTSVYVPKNGDLDAYLKGWLTDLRDNMATPDKRLYLPLDGIAGGATTDADGRFRLTGAGQDRILYVRFEGAGIARTQPQVITRPGLDTKPYETELLKKEHDDLRVLNRFKGPLPPDLTLVAEPGRTLEGVVTDPAGKPVAGATVDCSTGWADGVVGVTDAAGKYRLEGIPKNANGYSVGVQPPGGSGLLGGHAGALDTEGVGPVRLDAKLAKGVVVTGRVTDKQTGKGVRAGVRLAPLPDNKYFAATPGSDGYRTDRTMQSTDADGRFRLVTIPGRSLLMVQAQDDSTKFNGEYFNPYRTAEPEPAFKDLFRHDPDDGWIFTSVDNSLEFLNNEHAVKVVDLKETGETTVDLTVDRGVTGKLEVRGPDGKPLTGAYLAGMTDAWPVTFKLPEAAATVYALDATRPRTVAVYHPAKKLAGTAVVRGDEKEAVVVTLAETASVTGRFVDENGSPLAGADVTVNAERRVFSELYRFTAKEAAKVVTDAKGNFTLPGVVPGMSFYLQIRKGEQYYGGKPKIGLLNLKAGETKALGDRTLEVLR